MVADLLQPGLVRENINLASCRKQNRECLGTNNVLDKVAKCPPTLRISNGHHAPRHYGLLVYGYNSPGPPIKVPILNATLQCGRGWSVPDRCRNTILYLAERPLTGSSSHHVLPSTRICTDYHSNVTCGRTLARLAARGWESEESESVCNVCAFISQLSTTHKSTRTYSKPLETIFAARLVG